MDFAGYLAEGIGDIYFGEHHLGVLSFDFILGDWIDPAEVGFCEPWWFELDVFSRALDYPHRIDRWFYSAPGGFSFSESDAAKELHPGGDSGADIGDLLLRGC